MPRRPFHWTIALFAQKYIPHISDFTFLLLNQVVGEPGSAALPGGVAQGASTLTDIITQNTRTFELTREEALSGQCEKRVDSIWIYCRTIQVLISIIIGTSQI